VAEDDGDVDRYDVGATGQQRDDVHDVYRQPAQSKHGQHHAEPLGRSYFHLPRQLVLSSNSRGMLLLLLLTTTISLRVVDRRLVYITNNTVGKWRK